MKAAAVEVGPFLGVPVVAPGLATDAKHMNVQAGYEKALKSLTVATSGADLISGGVGLIEAASTLYLPR